MQKTEKYFKNGLLVALAVFAADQLHKYIMLHQFDFIDGKMVEVTSFFNLVMVWNYGISFGMMNNGSADNAIILAAMAVAIVSILVIWLRKITSKYEAIAVGMIIGGALGNALDRVMYGACLLYTSPSPRDH
jgi:signal peptidase II